MPKAIESHPVESSVSVQTGSTVLVGDLSIPRQASGLILFAHGSGSSRSSPRNGLVAQRLHGAGFATLLIDLLTPEEEQDDLHTRRCRFDIGMLADRLVGAIDWLAENEPTADLAVGCFGASTGAAAALIAAARRPAAVQAVVSRGGRPDLARRALRDVRAPSLLIVGGLDVGVIELNRQALTGLTGAHQLRIVPGASHLFEEQGKLEEVADLAADWFSEHLATTRS